ncbi:MAG: VanZ family protein [Clostridia bacterium]|nr:VanZ family protein [Clostridia bacterium]
MTAKIKKASEIIFIIYALIMLWLLFGQRWGFDNSTSYSEQLRQNINLVPFETIRLFLNMAENSASGYMTRYAFRNLIGNVVMFIPLGLLPCISKKLNSFIKYIITVIVIIVIIEVIQLFTLLGSCDIDDLMLNVAGAIIGYWIVRITDKKIPLLQK